MDPRKISKVKKAKVGDCLRLYPYKSTGKIIVQIGCIRVCSGKCPYCFDRRVFIFTNPLRYEITACSYEILDVLTAAEAALELL